MAKGRFFTFTLSFVWEKGSCDNSRDVVDVRYPSDESITTSRRRVSSCDRHQQRWYQRPTLTAIEGNRCQFIRNTPVLLVTLLSFADFTARSIPFVECLLSLDDVLDSKADIGLPYFLTMLDVILNLEYVVEGSLIVSLSLSLSSILMRRRRENQLSFKRQRPLLLYR
jgi:hypothetical protein